MEAILAQAPRRKTVVIRRGFEKLPPEKIAEINSRDDDVQTIRSGCLDIFYLPILAVWDEKRVFQQLLLITTVVRRNGFALRMKSFWTLMFLAFPV